ncbi:PREDICTED: putative gustatory receptor 28b isoform X2 [Dinoponera quadriceps]|uniref:Gustatory receptor n=1 Tax=Dinoponera quadriceps TaxID=609295 RepID=A0A6P3XJR1_DINQU|nr:PREDICTED: putative gustatory receptor 28b isoform X2 [Dinoponera quadriceps]
MDAHRVFNIFGNLEKVGIVTERFSKQKTTKIKSRLHQDTLWPLRMLLTFFKVIGLATFSHYVATGKKRSPQMSCTFQYSELGIVYNAVLVSLMIASNYLSIPYRINMEYPNKTNMTMGIEVFQTFLGSTTICAILLSYCFGERSLVRIANRLSDVKCELDRLYRLYPSLRRQRVFRVLAVVCTLQGSLAMALLVCEYLAFYTSPIAWLSDILPTFHVGWFMIQYFLLVTVIQADLADVNQAIQSLSRVDTPNSQPQSLYQTRRVVISNASVHQLLQLRDVHYNLCEVCQDVSNFYSTPIVFGIFFMFFSLVYNGYYLLSPLLLSDEVLEYIILADTIIWLIFLTYPIMLLTTRITRILYEMGKTGNAIHKLLSCTIGNVVKSELKQFSLQLLHRKIHFTASGYFSLDNTLFHSMGSLSTPLCNCTQENLPNTDE